jgi:4-hydroxy-2-oxoheptanedioate aldolase
MEASGRIVARAKAHGKYAAIFCFDGADAAAMAALGLRLCSIATDTTLLRGAARAELEAAGARAAAGTRKRTK